MNAYVLQIIYSLIDTHFLVHVILWPSFHIATYKQNCWVTVRHMFNFTPYLATTQYCHLEKAMAPHSSTPAWKTPWTEEPGGLQSMGSLRVRHDWVTSLSLFTFMHWRRKWHPTPVFLPGESQGRGAWWAAVMGSHRVGHDWRASAAQHCHYLF